MGQSDDHTVFHGSNEDYGDGAPAGLFPYEKGTHRKLIVRRQTPERMLRLQTSRSSGGSKPAMETRRASQREGTPQKMESPRMPFTFTTRSAALKEEKSRGGLKVFPLQSRQTM